MCPDYMADGVYTARSEIFSLGLVMAELLTGHLHLDAKAPQKLRLSTERVLRGIPADARAGAWPGDAVQQLKALVGRCPAGDIEERPADMATVVRELRALLEQHCPASASEAGDAMIAELAAARAQLDRMRLDQQFQDMQRARAAAPQLQCCVCMETFSASQGCTCSGGAPGHFYCNECFSDMVASQVTGEGKPVFLAAGCEVTCSFCQPSGLRSVFDMRLCAPYLTPAAYSTHLKTMAEPEVVREQHQWQQRMQQQEADFTARLQNAQHAAAAAALDPHVKHIADQLILPRCPTQSCGRFIPDFEACAGLQVCALARLAACWLVRMPISLLLLNRAILLLQCGRLPGRGYVAGLGCGAHLCAWCMHVCRDEDDCHAHVRSCRLNPNPGNVFPPQPHPQTWRGVMNRAACQRVQA